MKEAKKMALRNCKDCPCFETKVEGGPLGIGSFHYGWCNRFKTRKDKDQDACSWAKEEDRKGGRYSC